MNVRAVLVLLLSLASTREGLTLRASAGKLEPLGGSHYYVGDDGMRAESSTRSGVAELRFRYHGPSTTTTPLASGEVRRQIGLKLRAHDTCNVVYVMWHVAPDSGVFVSVKRNPGRTLHAECGACGYIDMPIQERPVLEGIRPGDEHTLRAEISGSTLRVTADGILVWQDRLPDAAFELDGPVGARSDNGTFDFELR